MNFELSIIGTLGSAMAATAISGMLAILLCRKGIAYRNLIWFLLMYFISEAASGFSVSSGLYFHKFTLAEAIFRVISMIAKWVFAGRLAYSLGWLIDLLCHTRNEEKAQALKDSDEEVEQLQHRQNLVFMTSQIRQDTSEDLQRRLSSVMR